MFHFWPTITWLARYFQLGAFNFSFLSARFPTKLEWISTCHFKGVFQNFECWSPTNSPHMNFVKNLILSASFTMIHQSIIKIINENTEKNTLSRTDKCRTLSTCLLNLKGDWLILIDYMILIKWSPSLPTGMSCGIGWKSVLNSRYVTATDFYRYVTLPKAF